MPHYYYPGWVGGGGGGWGWVEIIRIKAVLSSTGLDWTGTKLGKSERAFSTLRYDPIENSPLCLQMPCF